MYVKALSHREIKDFKNALSSYVKIMKKPNNIGDYEKIIGKKDEIITGLEKDVTDLTRKNNNLKSGIKWLGGGFVASVLTIITFIVVK